MQNALSGSWLSVSDPSSCDARCVVDQSPLKYLKIRFFGAWWGLGLGEIYSFEILSDTFCLLPPAIGPRLLPLGQHHIETGDMFQSTRTQGCKGKLWYIYNIYIYIIFIYLYIHTYTHTHILQRQNKYQRKNTHGGFNCFSCGFFGPNCLAHMTLAIFYWLWQSAQHHVKNLLTMLSMVQQSGCIFHLFARHDREGKPGKLYEAKWFLRECIYIYMHTTTSLLQTGPKPWVDRKTR